MLEDTGGLLIERVTETKRIGCAMIGAMISHAYNFNYRGMHLS